ncbi:hypothetical protein [Microbispora sp. H10670]|uniref:hypothetical protein n=1 Tax=Microbispora sp. H10670 TaxID=2729108 RepID=UPI0015FFBB34|nr:hypothetical protein [Microbispora sp. H10670]
MTAPRYFSVSSPAPHNKSGTARITVRIGGAYPAYLCVGNGRVPLTTDEAWAVWVALGNALTTVHGPAPAWAAEQIQLTCIECGMAADVAAQFNQLTGRQEWLCAACHQQAVSGPDAPEVG